MLSFSKETYLLTKWQESLCYVYLLRFLRALPRHDTTLANFKANMHRKKLAPPCGGGEKGTEMHKAMRSVDRTYR